MNMYGKRGAFIFALYSFALSVTLLFNFGKIFAAFSVVIAIAVSVFVVIGSKKKASAIIISVITVAAPLAGIFVGKLNVKNDSAAKAYADGNEHIVSFEITDIIYEKPFGSLYYAKVSSVDGSKSDFSVSIEFPFLPELGLHSNAETKAVLTEPDDSDLPYMRSKGVILSIAADEYTLKSEGKLTFPEKANALLANIFGDNIGGEEAGFAEAIFLGNREKTTQKTKLAFRRSGTSHLLALSGLHLSVLAMGLEFSLRTFGLKKKIRITVSIAATVLFAVITGLSASVLRAAIMLIIYFISQLIGEERDSLTSLFVSLAIILSLRAGAVWDVGLWMSFSATLGLVLFTDKLLPHFKPMTRKTYSKAKKLFRGAFLYVLGTFCATMIATLFTLPITYLAFGGVSLVSPVSNLVLVPLSQLLLYLLAILCLVSGIPIAAPALGIVSKYLIKFICSLAEMFASPSGVYISIKYPFVPYIIAAAFIAVALIVFVPKIKPRAIFAVFIAAVVAFAGGLSVWRGISGNDIYAVALSEKSSDAVSLVYRGRSIVIDISTGGFSVPYRAMNETSGYAAGEIDLYVLTHLHRYHVASFDKLCGYYKINKLLLPSAENASDAEQILKLVNIAEENGTEVEFYNRRAESTVTCGDMKIVLPGYVLLKRSVHPVINFSVFLGDEKVLLYSGAATEETGTDGLYSDAQLVIFGAHGPLRKQKTDTEICVSAQRIIFANANVLSFYENCSSPFVLSEKGGKASIKIIGDK